MTTFISILRGINVSGHNKLKMEALKELYTHMGFSEVQTYIQSGNIIFQSVDTNTQLLGKRIALKIFDTFSINVPVLILSVEELKYILQNNPFINDPAKDSAFIHLTFLSAIPERTDIEKLTSKNYLPDEFKWMDNVIYLYCPNGYGKTRLTNTFFESKLKITATTRNIKTANELLLISTRLSGKL